jgi:gas vesicle protein
MKPGKIILTVISAAAAGLLTGLLFAPEKGNRTRRRILEKGQDAIDDMIIQPITKSGKSEDRWIPRAQVVNQRIKNKTAKALKHSSRNHLPAQLKEYLNNFHHEILHDSFL